MTKTPAVPNIAALPRRRPTRQDAEEAVRTLLAWSGDDPSRAGLIDTPARVVDAYGEYFSGYKADAAAELATAFVETAGYTDMVMLAGIRFESHCEHHIAPFYGEAHVAYIPNGRIAGLSKIARVVEIFARRLQTQEALTCEIAKTIAAGLDAKGVAVMMRAEHQCMSMRGVRQPHVATLTTHFTGRFESDDGLRARFVQLTGHGQA
jgi:GTP cyclohydrolase IA